MKFVLAVVVAASALTGRPDLTRKDDAGPVWQIYGEWQDCKSPQHAIRFMKSESLLLVNGNPSPEDGLTASYSINWTKNPVAIDFKPRNQGPYAGILKVEGDRLTLAIGMNGLRPTDFSAKNLVLQYRLIRK
jgi:hypothetical protein